MNWEIQRGWFGSAAVVATLLLTTSNALGQWVTNGLAFYADARAAGSNPAQVFQALVGTSGTLYDLNASGNMPVYTVDGDTFTHRVGGVDSAVTLSYYQFSFTDDVGGGMIDFGPNQMFNFDQDYTYEVLYKPSAPPVGQSAGRSQVFGTMMNSQTGNAIRWRQRADDLILGRGISEFDERDNVGTQRGRFSMSNGARWDPNTWLHVVVTHVAGDPLTDTAPVLKIYTTGLDSFGTFMGPAFNDPNEVQQGNTTLAAWWGDEFDFVNQPNNTLSMGATDMPTNGNFTSELRMYFGGRIAMARIYDRVLNEAEVIQNYESLSTVPTPPGPLVGDLDGDGFVGIADLNIVLGAWNQNVPPANPAADTSGDGFVGIEDLNTVLGNWNAGTPPANVAVPEPASLALLVSGGLVLLKRRP
jgi:hypothetical protein